VGLRMENSMRATNVISVGTLGIAMIIMSQPVYSKPTLCAVVAAQCEGHDRPILAPKIETAKAVCNGLQSCQSLCHDELKAMQKAHASVTKKCLTQCRNDPGGQRPQCRKECQTTKRRQARNFRQAKRQCSTKCRAQWRGSECKKARTVLSFAAASAGLECASRLASACASISP